MDSPETTAKTNTAASSSFSAAASTAAITSSSSSPPVQESPSSNYTSNLSPIKPVKSSHGLQGLLGLNSPPLVFTSSHINAPRETNFLKRLDRLPCHQSPSAEISQNDSGGRKFVDGSGDLENSDLLLHGGLVTEPRKDNDMRSSLQVQPSSSSGCVDEYLTDAVDVDSANSAYEVNIDLKQSSDVLQSSGSGRTDSKKTLSKFGDKNDAESKVEVAVDMFGEAEENIYGKSTRDIKPIKNEENATRGIWPSNECSKIESNSYLDHTSKRHQSENSSAQNEGSVPRDESDCPIQVLPEPFQTLEIYEDSREIAGAIPHGPHDNAMHDPELLARGSWLIYPNL